MHTYFNFKYWDTRNSGGNETSRVFSGRTRTNFGLRFAIETGRRPELSSIHETNDRHHTKIPRKNSRSSIFSLGPRARGPRARVTGGWPDIGHRLRTNHASASKSETCSGLCMESGFWDMFKLKRKAKNKIDRNLQFRITQ